MASPKSVDALEKILSKPDKILDLVATSLAEESLGLIKDGFRTETDPYGQKWVPKQRKDGRKTLSGETSRLKTGWKIKRQDRDEIRISPSVPYALYHQAPLPRRRITDRELAQRGARNIDIGGRRSRSRARDPFTVDTIGPAQLTRPRRMMVPDETMGLPPRWEKKLNEAATDAFAAIFGGDGRRVAGVRKALDVDALVGFELG